MQPTTTFRLISGLEPTRIISKTRARTIPPDAVDVLGQTEHDIRYAADFALAASVGIHTLRIAAPWQRIEKERGKYDFRWFGPYMDKLQEMGIEPILDPLHHTSFPSWLTGGFAHPDFVDVYTKFVQRLMEEYPWATKYTIINEALVTTMFCGEFGIWYPFKKGKPSFYRMLIQVARAIRDISVLLEKKGLQHWWMDSCEVHRGYDPTSRDFAEQRNLERFELLDLLLGKVTANHPLYQNFLKGMEPADIAQFAEQPVVIHCLGLDYYAHSELEWISGKSKKSRFIRRRTLYPVGFTKTALEYVERYKLPVMLGETNLRGFVTDRITWFKYMLAQCEELSRLLAEREIDFYGICWYPLIDCCDWDTLVTQPNRRIDPQGIFSLDVNFDRYASEFSRTVAAVAAGKISSKEVPAYRFRSPLSVQLQGFINGPMQRYAWQEPLPAVLITGASNGIGTELAKMYAGAGYPLILTYLHDEQAGLAASKACREKGTSVMLQRMDVTDPASVSTCVQAAQKWLLANGLTLGTVINNAGVIIKKPFAAYTADEILVQTMTNLVGPQLVTQACLDLHPQQVIFIGSEVALEANPHMAPYTASKWGLRGFALALARSTPGFQVICVHPDKTGTRMNDGEGRTVEETARAIFRCLTAAKKGKKGGFEEIDLRKVFAK